MSFADYPTSIGLTKAAIRAAELLVTTDSGPRHFAQPFDVPVVTLFGPTHQAWSETENPNAVHLQIKVDCGPCQRRECPLKHHRCMRDLSIDWVFDAIIAQLLSMGEGWRPEQHDCRALACPDSSTGDQAHARLQPSRRQDRTAHSPAPGSVAQGKNYC